MNSAALVLFMALVGMASAKTFQQCISRYEAKPPTADSCEYVARLTRCVADVLSSGNSDANSLSQTADYLSGAWKSNSDCDVSSVSSFPGTVESLDSNLDFQLGAAADILFTTFQRTNIKSSDLVAWINALTPNQNTLNTRFTANLTSITAAAKATVPSSAIDALASTALGAIDAQISTYTVNANSGRAWFDGNLTAISNYNTLTAQPAIVAEENALSSWQYNTLNQLGAQRLALQVGLSDDSSDVVSIAGEDQGILLSVSGNVTTELNNFVNAEVSRAASKLIITNGEISTLAVNLQADVNVALTTEVSTVNSRAVVFASAATSKLASTSGSTDNGACTVDGAMYYSTGSGRAFVCLFKNNKLWTPIAWTSNGFIRAGSKILTLAAHDIMLNRFMGLDASWVKCYDASAQGWSPTTFHNNCNNKGATMTLMVTSAGRIFGGFTEIAWISRNGYCGGGQSFIFRISPTSSQIESASYPNEIQTYAGYDHVSYCPTFGGASDIVNSSPCQTPSFAPSYYQAPSYSNTWIAGSSSVTLSRLEVFNRVYL